MSTATIGHNAPPPLKEILAENYSHFAKEIDEIAERANAAPKAIKSDNDLDAVGVIVKDAKGMINRVEKARKEEKDPYFQAGKEVDAFFKLLWERLDRIAAALGGRADDYQRQKAAEARRKAEEEARKLREKEEAERRKAEEAAAAGKDRVADRADIKAETLADKAAEAERAAQASAADLARTRGASGTLASAKTVTKVRIVDLTVVQQSMGPLGPYMDSDAIQKAANTWLRVTKGAGSIAGLEVYDDVKATFR